MNCSNWSRERIKKEIDRVKYELNQAREDSDLDAKERYDLIADLNGDLTDLREELAFRNEMGED